MRVPAVIVFCSKSAGAPKGDWAHCQRHLTSVASMSPQIRRVHGAGWGGNPIQIHRFSHFPPANIHTHTHIVAWDRGYSVQDVFSFSFTGCDTISPTTAVFFVKKIKGTREREGGGMVWIDGSVGWKGEVFFRWKDVTRHDTGEILETYVHIYKRGD